MDRNIQETQNSRKYKKKLNPHLSLKEANEDIFFNTYLDLFGGK